MRLLRYFVIFLVAICGKAAAQVGNEWINFSQSYFKIPVAKNGIYKLGLAELEAVGFPATAIDPTRIQLFHRGVEQAIYIEGEGDGTFDDDDFITFYGRRNDGTLDAQLYVPASVQPHSRYNLYSDTTSYFLTVGGVPGKRMPLFFETNTDGLAAEASHTDEKNLLLTSQYAGGIDYGEVQVTPFDRGEGWTGNQITENQFIDYTLPNITNGVASAGLPQLEILVVGRGPMQHAGEIYVGAGQRLLSSFNFAGFGTHAFSQSIAWADIGADGTLPVRIKVIGIGGQPDRFSACYITLKYPQQLDGGGAPEKVFILSPNTDNKSFIEIANPAPGLQLFDITDPANVSRIGTTITSGLNAIVPGTNIERRIFATTQSITPGIHAVNFRQITPSQHDYIIISHPLLRTPALGYNDPVKAYAEYRASDQGGSYDTLVVNVQQLYDQFNYGESSPLAIFHFMKFLANSSLPKYLLLAGNGLDVYYQYFRDPQSFTTFKDFVPAAGFPGSDMAYTAGLAGSTYAPAVPTGRIPAWRSEDIAAYLNKVKEMEALPYDGLWRKNVLHLSGGIAENEPQTFKSYMEDFQAIAEDYYLGGKVSAVAKYSRQLEHINVAEQVNSGLNLVTFFGHSSTSTLDFEIGNVTDPVQGYSNKGKYPVLLINGCNAGSFFVNYPLMGEDWVLAKDRGAIGFIAHSAFGFVNLLKKYTETFYEVGYQDPAFLTQGIGDIQKETARRFMLTATPSPANITQIQQMVLAGDPAVRLFGAPRADLEINEDNLSIESFDGQPITALTDSFRISMIIRNFGQAKKDTIRVEVLRTLSDNSTLVYDSLYPAVKYSDTLSMVIRKGREMAFGNNSFRVTLDPDDVLPEITKENNAATKTLIVPLNGTKNLYPANFGIVHSPQVTVAFQTTDLLSGEREFLVELDTVDSFDSPFKVVVSVSGKVLARKVFSLLSLDSVAYYWRTKLAEPLAGESILWTQNSFTYIKDGPEGWAQIHFPQFLQNQTDGLVKDAGLRELRFQESVTTVSIKTFGSNHPAPFTDVSIKIAGAEYNLYGPGYDCRDNSINLIAFDRKSTVPYTAVNFEWYNRAGRNCGRKPWVINNFVPSQMVTGNNDDLIQYVDNVQVGDSVLLYSTGDAAFSAWPALAKIKLGELGISVAQIDALQDGEPVIIFARKGSVPGSATFFLAEGFPKDLQELSVSKTITGGYTTGSMRSSLIGPAAKWDSFINTPVKESPDQASFDIVGVKLNGNEEVILDDVTGKQDLSIFDPAEFPYLRVVFDTGDETDLTPAQLDKWLVTFTPVAEGLLLYFGSEEQAIVYEGQDWEGQYGFVNISDKPFSDSLTARHAVFNHTVRTSEVSYKMIAPPLPGDTTSFMVRVKTSGKEGLNDIDIFVNPRLLPEQYYDNNALQLAEHLNVFNELFHPVLDVSIDGRHITDGDFVSPNPLILATLWDDNKFILKKDTAGVRIFLTYPCPQDACVPTPVWLSSDKVKWHAATDTSAFKVEFRPANLEDGTYKLRVEGADSRGNASGTDPYEISFVVKNESHFSVSDPYPNPFSDQVFINIVISGNVLPDLVDLQVLNINGQTQLRFDGGNFAPFHIGTNELNWNGANQVGEFLPNGVYIYKLQLLVNGGQVTKMGKLVLVR